MPSRREVYILSTDDVETEEVRSILSEGRFGSTVFQTVDELEAGLWLTDCLAVILDVDSVALSNRVIRMLKENFPAVSIFCTSRRRFHPELQDALSRHISACLSKPVDPDELHFWLKAIDTNGIDARSPP
jgi:DNA-binding NarL/FixJ family response regulator